MKLSEMSLEQIGATIYRKINSIPRLAINRKGRQKKIIPYKVAQCFRERRLCFDIDTGLSVLTHSQIGRVTSEYYVIEGYCKDNKFHLIITDY